MATTNDLKNGIVLNLDGQLWTVVEFQHVKPGKGGAFVRTKLKNVMSGKVVDKTFNAGTKVETATVDKRDMQYLYKDGTDYIFMDGTSYEQIPVAEVTVGDASHFLLENQTATVAIHEGTPLYVELPTSVVLEITYTEPGLQGDRSTGGHQAGHARDRLRHPGAAVPRDRHQGQGRHPDRGLPRPRQLTAARTPHARSVQGPQARARRPVRGRAAPARPVARCSTSGRPPPTRRCPEYAADLVRGRRGQPRAAGRADLDATPRAGRWTGCRRSTARCCGWAPTSCCSSTTCRTRSRSARPSLLARQLSTDDSPGVRQRAAGPAALAEAHAVALTDGRAGNGAPQRLRHAEPAAAGAHAPYATAGSSCTSWRASGASGDRRLAQSSGCIVASTARRASASRTPHVISSSASAAGGMS